MRRLFSSFFAVLILGVATNLAVAQKLDNERILMVVDQDSVAVDEFLYAFWKNNNSETPPTKEEINEYLDLYVKFKLKVVKAKSLGYDTTASFTKEFQQYQSQLQNTYLVSDTETTRLVQEAYERMKFEVEASHILLTLDPNALPSDTLVTYNRMIDIREQAINGEDFGALAQQYSQDPSARTNKGLLGYFSAFQMVYAFETAAFETPVGEISMPIRTQFGYHIIKVQNKRPSEGKVRVAHIMIQPPSEQSENEINVLYEQLQAGADWLELCKQQSDDRRTADKGGELAPFGRGQIVPEFADVAFSLDSAGQISDPLQTQFGWHIIKLIEKLPLKPFGELEEELTRRVKRDSRNEVNKQVLIERLARENNFKRNAPGERELISLPKKFFVKGRWRLDSTWLTSETELFSIGRTVYPVGPFLTWMVAKIPHDSTSVFLNQRLTEYREEALITYEKNHLADKYDDYRFLNKEYYEGILLFSIMENEVWNKAMEDSLGLLSYYNAHKQDYPRAKGVEAILFNVSDKSTLVAISDTLARTPLTHLLSASEKQTITDKFKGADNVSLSIDQGYYVSGDNQLVDLTNTDSKIHQQGESWTLVHIIGRHEAGVEPLDNIRGKVMADYQDYLEKQWVGQLKDQYSVDIDNKTLNYVYKSARKK